MMTTTFSFLQIMCCLPDWPPSPPPSGLYFPGGSSWSDLFVSSGYGLEKAMPKRCADKAVKTAREASGEGVLHRQQHLPSTWQNAPARLLPPAQQIW